LALLKDKQTDIEALQYEFETAYPQEILRWAIENYGNKLALVSSFQATGIVTLHMMKAITDDFQVLTLDTGLLFPATYQFIADIEQFFDISVHRIQSQQSLPKQARDYGSLLWETDPNQCCHLRKTLPLHDTLQNYDAWITGIRRDQSTTRAQTPVISWDARNGLLKLAPFATWTEEMIWTYIESYELPFNPLHQQGYPSIGCYTCTLAANGNDSRSGRWAGSTKTECGIHVDLVAEKQQATA
jgi:phosphoadenosine phosphosulfate reductase